MNMTMRTIGIKKVLCDSDVSPRIIPKNSLLSNRPWRPRRIRAIDQMMVAIVSSFSFWWNTSERMGLPENLRAKDSIRMRRMAGRAKFRTMSSIVKT